MATVLVVYAAVEVFTGGGLKTPPAPRPAALAVPGTPFGYSTTAAAAFSARATLGEASVHFQKSPGGIVATARRVAAWRSDIDRAVRGTNIKPALLEGVVFLESAGDPQALAGNSASDAAGLTQILAGTGQTMLGMKINLRRSEKLTKQIGRALNSGTRQQVQQLEQERAKVDERFRPEAELAATVRYLKTAEASLGDRADLAVAAYHAGIGSLEQILSLYGEGDAVPYSQLYFDTSPISHQNAWQALTDLTDDGANYYWRVLGAERVMSLWRHNRAALNHWALQLESYPSNALVLLGNGPEGQADFPDPGSIANAYWTTPAILTPLPSNSAQLHLAYASTMGGHAAKLGAPRAIYRGLRPDALRMLIQIAAWVDQIADTTAPMTVASTISDTEYNNLLDTDDLPATSGYTFEIERKYASSAQADAFQFVLDRLQALNLIAWIRHPSTIEITVAPDAASVITHGIRN
jgi:hypothetical protein